MKVTWLQEEVNDMGVNQDVRHHRAGTDGNLGSQLVAF